MSSQNYENHGRLVPPYHIGLSLLLLIALGCSGWNLFRAFGQGESRLVGLSLVLLILGGILQFWYSRIFALKAQDRAIRAEENLRHFALTGSLLDSQLTIGQIIGLRFAPDSEFVDLAGRAAQESLSPDAIKKSVKQWRADEHRV